MRIYMRTELDLGDLGTVPASLEGSVEYWGTPLGARRPEGRYIRCEIIRVSVWIGDDAGDVREITVTKRISGAARVSLEEELIQEFERIRGNE